MSGMGEPLDRLLLKVQRSRKHVLDLEAEQDRFFKTNPYRFRFETNPQTGNRDYYLADAKPIPLEFSLLIGDALNNLRAALDHTAYHLVCVGVGAIRSFPDAKFPIYENAPDYHSKRNGAVAGMRQDAIKAIDAIQPYGGGAGEYFWHLARLNNIDKHRLLVTAWTSLFGIPTSRSDREFIARFHGGSPDDYQGSTMAVHPRIVPLKAGDKICTIPKSEVHENMNFLLGVAFSEPEMVRGNPVVETLHEMTKVVHDLIVDFYRFGLFR